MARTRRAVVALAMVMAIAGVSTAPAAQTSAAPPELAKPVRNALDKKWKNWQFAATPPACAGAGGSAAPAAAALAADADFNGDGTPDLALTIATETGPILAAVIVRMDDADVYEVDKLPAGGATLSIRKRGTKYFRAGLTVDQYFGADAIALTPCGGGDVVAYLFNGAGFRRETIAAAPIKGIAPAAAGDRRSAPRR